MLMSLSCNLTDTCNVTLLPPQQSLLGFLLEVTNFQVKQVPGLLAGLWLADKAVIATKNAN